MPPESSEVEEGVTLGDEATDELDLHRARADLSQAQAHDGVLDRKLLRGARVGEGRRIDRLLNLVKNRKVGLHRLLQFLHLGFGIGRQP